MQDVFCAKESDACGEGLWGTAVSHTSLWIALEVREPWGRKAFEECELGDPANKRVLEDLAEAHPELRIQLIRRPEVRRGDPALYVARTGFGKQSLWRVPLTGYDDLPSMNWAAWARGEVQWAAWRQQKPLYLVCVHGRRDRCCAQRGMPVYAALEERVRGRVWQTSHLGGHRFAATLVSLPDGVCYGRVEPVEAPALLTAREAGRFYDLGRVRGRTSLASVAQAAECAVRTHTGDLALSDMRLEEISESDDGVVQVVMVDDRGQRASAQLRRVRVGEAPASCGAEPTPVYRYEVLGVETLVGGS